MAVPATIQANYSKARFAGRGVYDVWTLCADVRSLADYGIERSCLGDVSISATVRGTGLAKYCCREENKGKTSLRRYLLIAIGGALGAILRYVVGVFAAERFGTRFPAGTFAINISACFMIGFILEYLTRHGNMNPAWRFGFAIGFLGAYSTFSSFEWETWTQLTRGAYWMALLYVGASLMIGLLAVGLGSAAARSFR